MTTALVDVFGTWLDPLRVELVEGNAPEGFVRIGVQSGAEILLHGETLQAVLDKLVLAGAWASENTLCRAEQ